MDRASEDDFAAYVGLRWQPLVRTLVLLGCPTDRAEQVTRTALSRVHRSWARVRRADDVDVQVFRRLLHTWPETRRRHTRRTALVLHTVGGLTEAQVGAVLGSGAVAVGDHLDEDDPLGLLGRRPDDVEVGPPPLDAIVAGSARARGVRRRVLLTALAVVTLVAAVTVVVVSRNGPTGPSPSTAGPASRAVKQAAVPYLADGVLHVGRLTRPVRPVTDLVDPGVGAVYRSDEADVRARRRPGRNRRDRSQRGAGAGGRRRAGLGLLADLQPAACRVRRAPRPPRPHAPRHRTDRLVPLRAAARPDRRHRLLPHAAHGPGVGRRPQPGDHRGLGPRPGVPRAKRRPRGGPGPRPPRASWRPAAASACGDATD